MNPPEVIALVLGSGVITGLVSGVVTLVAGKWDRSHRTKEREAMAAHEARLRRELAHDGAREKFLGPAERLEAWAFKYSSERHYDANGDWIYVESTRPMAESQGVVLDLLREITHGHPTRSVRKYAQELFTDIDNQWTALVDGEVQEPTLQQVADWHLRTNELVELIHAPEEPSNG